jgi:hypothetical protein
VTFRCLLTGKQRLCCSVCGFPCQVLNVGYPENRFQYYGRKFELCRSSHYLVGGQVIDTMIWSISAGTSSRLVGGWSDRESFSDARGGCAFPGFSYSRPGGMHPPTTQYLTTHLHNTRNDPLYQRRMEPFTG